MQLGTRFKNQRAIGLTLIDLNSVYIGSSYFNWLGMFTYLRNFTEE